MAADLFARREFGLIAAIAAVTIPVALVNPRMLSAANLSALAMDAALLMIVATAQMLVLLTRNIDLSVAAVIGLAAYGAASTLHLYPEIGIVGGVLLVCTIGLGCGLLNGCHGTGHQDRLYDSDVAGDARTLFLNQAKGDSLAEMMIESMGQLIDYKGDFAILSSTPTATNQNAWIETMKEKMAADAKFAEMNLVQVAYGEESEQINQQQALALAFPNLKGISFLRASGFRRRLARWSRQAFSGRSNSPVWPRRP